MALKSPKHSSQPFCRGSNDTSSLQKRLQMPWRPLSAPVCFRAFKSEGAPRLLARPFGVAVAFLPFFFSFLAAHPLFDFDFVFFFADGLVVLLELQELPLFASSGSETSTSTNISLKDVRAPPRDNSRITSSGPPGRALCRRPPPVRLGGMAERAQSSQVPKRRKRLTPKPNAYGQVRRVKCELPEHRKSTNDQRGNQHANSHTYQT